MDRDYSREWFTPTNVDNSVGDCRDAKTPFNGGYSARFRDDLQLEKNSLRDREYVRSLGANPKDDKAYQHGSRSLAVAERGAADGQYSGVPRRPETVPPSGYTTESAKVPIDEPPVFATIRQLLKPMSKEDDVQTAVFDLYGDMHHFRTEQLEEETNLATVLTVSGTGSSAFAATCEDYIRFMWSEFGIGVLSRLVPISKDSKYADNAAVAAKLDGCECDIVELEPYHGYSRSRVVATGKTENLIKVAQILAWMMATFRRPKHGELSYSTPAFTKTYNGAYSISMLPLEPIQDGVCWCPMFPSGIIAKDFPIPKRHGEIGLEIPFNLMVVLGRVWYPMEYLNGFVLKGYSTILVPTIKTQHSVQWHFIHDKDHRKKIKMSVIKNYCEKVVEDVDIGVLQTARAFVGWTQDARVHAGAKTSGYDSIRDSKASYSPRRPRLTREITSGIGTSGLGFFGMQLGTKVVIPKGVFGPVKREHILLEDRLLNSMNSPLLIWDAGTRRGWMVSEISALLMILHVWAARQTDSEILLKKIPFAKLSSDDAKASYDAIRASRNLQLRSQAEGGGEDLKFTTQLENIFAAVESRREEIITQGNAYVRFSRSTYLTGWEMIDIAHSKPWFKEKRVTLDDTCGTWPSVIEKQREVLVLFCQGIGDLIKPRSDESFCETWKSVPKDRSYLATTVACVENLDIHCGFANRFKDCNFNHKTCSSRLQELSHRPPSRSIPLPSTGAIIVGRAHHSLYQTCSLDSGQLQNTKQKLYAEQEFAQDTCKVLAVENGDNSSYRRKFLTSEDSCPTPDGGNDIQRKRRIRTEDNDVHA